MDKIIDLDEIPKSPRYIYTVDFIFPNEYTTVAAFVKRNERTDFHVQEFYEICVISRGEGYHAIENIAVKAKRGDVFIVPPGRRHAILGGEGFDVHYLHLSPKYLEKYSTRMRDLSTFLSLFEIEPMMRINGSTYRHLYLEDAPLKEVVNLIEFLENKWQHDAPSRLILESYITIILTIFCREYEKLQTTVGKNASNDKLFMNSISYIVGNINKKITIEELSHMAGLSRTEYIRRFREATGESPKQFITVKRINTAKLLLLSTDRSIGKIAEDTGFYDTAHFSKAFLGAVGMSPTDYRRNGIVQ